MRSEQASPVFNILVIEDNAADLRLLRHALTEAGLKFKLTVIEDGAAALAFVRSEGEAAVRCKPDLAVLDLNLPRHGGLEILEALRLSKNLSNLCVTIMTSSAGPQERARAQALGVRRFITKPINLQEFLQIGTLLKTILFETRASPATGLTSGSSAG